MMMMLDGSARRWTVSYSPAGIGWAQGQMNVCASHVDEMLVLAEVLEAPPFQKETDQAAVAK